MKKFLFGRACFKANTFCEFLLRSVLVFVVHMHHQAKLNGELGAFLSRDRETQRIVRLVSSMLIRNLLI